MAIGGGPALSWNRSPRLRTVGAKRSSLTGTRTSTTLATRTRAVSGFVFVRPATPAAATRR